MWQTTKRSRAFTEVCRSGLDLRAGRRSIVTSTTARPGIRPVRLLPAVAALGDPPAQVTFLDLTQGVCDVGSGVVEVEVGAVGVGVVEVGGVGAVGVGVVE